MLNLKTVMRMNAASCLFFGVLMLLLPLKTSSFLGGAEGAPAFLITALGFILVLNGLHIIWATRNSTPKKALVLYFSAGDILWVLLSLVLIITGVWVSTVHGKIVTLIIAAMVGFFGLLQLRRRDEKLW